MAQITIRSISSSEYPILEEFLYHAIYLPSGMKPLPKDIIFKPEIYIYIKDFGSNDDICLVAEKNGIIVGAAWTRIIPAHGHLDDNTPELAISILPEHRNQGIGTKLLTNLFDILRKQGYKQTSLSVQKENPAFRLYKRLGYKIIEERANSDNHQDFLMIKYLNFMAL
jgi:ribosomal protein S18 acetylase RimI-like enzyme